MEKEHLIGKTLQNLRTLVAGEGMPSFAAGQIATWLYQKRVASIDEMTNLSKSHREILKQKYEVGRKSFSKEQVSTDGTKKYLFETAGGKYVESVFIPDKERATLCVSTQAGCRMNCLFCMTGKQGLKGQLTASAILNQILSVPESSLLTNIVFMGMGEPLDNPDELLKVLEIVTAPHGLAWSPKRVTVSTIGLLPALERFLNESQCHLAVSLHSPFHEERLLWMPVEKAYPAEAVLNLLKRHDFSHQRRLSFEYILFGGINDDAEHARGVIRLLSGIPCRVNLIRYHRIPGVDLPDTQMENAIRFRNYLSSKGITCTIRASRGEDILAACGMLSAGENSGRAPGTRNTQKNCRK